LKGKVSLLDDVRETTAVALKVNGFSINSTDAAQLDKAQKTLMNYKGHIKMFRSDTVDPLVNKEIAVAQAYSTDALQATAKSGGKIKYIIPEEGGSASIDNIAILKSAKNIEAAHKFINFVLSPEANVRFVQTIFGTPVVKGVKEKLPKELQEMTALFPSDEQMSKLEAIQDLGDKTELYDKLWTEVKTE
jgi:spermidine/putrescine transport system substrate-binding protein